MSSDDPLGNGHTLPLRASGEFGGYAYEFRGDVVGDRARDWSDVRGPHGGILIHEPKLRWSRVAALDAGGVELDWVEQDGLRRMRVVPARGLRS